MICHDICFLSIKSQITKMAVELQKWKSHWSNFHILKTIISWIHLFSFCLRKTLFFHFDPRTTNKSINSHRICKSIFLIIIFEFDIFNNIDNSHFCQFLLIWNMLQVWLLMNKHICAETSVSARNVRQKNTEKDVSR